MNVPESPAGLELRGEPVDEAEQARNRNTVARWAKAEGVALEYEAQGAREKLRNVEGAQR